jgi:hypothetical protein
MIFTNPQDADYYAKVEERGVLERHFSTATLERGRRVARVQLELLSRWMGGRKVMDVGCGA